MLKYIRIIVFVKEINAFSHQRAEFLVCYISQTTVNNHKLRCIWARPVVRLAVRQAVRQAHGPEQGRRGSKKIEEYRIILDPGSPR
jgi:hypothetical protein